MTTQEKLIPKDGQKTLQPALSLKLLDNSLFEDDKNFKPADKVILMMTVKKATTKANVLAIPMIFMVSTAAGVYYNS